MPTPEELATMAPGLRAQFEETAGDLKDGDGDLFDVPAGPKAKLAETDAPDVPLEAPEPAPASAPVSPVAAEPTPVAESTPAPAVPAPKKYAGRFDTPEQLEQHTQAQERHITELREGQQKLQRLLEAALATRAPADPTPKAETRPAEAPKPAPVPVELKALAKTINDYQTKVSLGEETTDEEVVAYAQALADLQWAHGKLAERVTEHAAPVVDQRLTEREQRAAEAKAQADKQTAFEHQFYTKFPQFKAVARPVMQAVATLARQSLIQANPGYTDWTDEEWVTRLIDQIGQDASKTLYVDAASAPAPPATPTPVPARPAVPSGARSEGPGALSPAAPATLTGQDKHLAELDGLWDER